MNTSKLPSPSEIASIVDGQQLEAGRLRLLSALTRCGGKTFTYAASLFPFGTKAILLAELAAAGWKAELKEDPREGDYYEIGPC